ncbi:hypothetical protein [Phytoactinopolyspora halotolerans]|uniref:Uncharacterized protein n=1 Tax=Phytoactinopolyspora halotolerans TaxID=1981512 RepID=A0A6L9SDW9_9ACTN|nr:hypothetical protein [Phytoactinopolyspora halotolerans]NEE03239.1 hypothetical protein [Phytoactinopolyspora halotolerans]
MKRRLMITMMTIVATVVLSLIPASGATSWYVKGSANSKGAGYWTTSSIVQTVVQNPYAIRIRFRTSNDKSNKVTYTYSVFCENGSKSAYDKTLWTNANNSWKYVTLYSGSNSLGRYCDVYVSSDLNSTARLRTQIQAKHR